LKPLILIARLKVIGSTILYRVEGYALSANKTKLLERFRGKLLHFFIVNSL
jgi:hypothetical protein